MMQTTHYPPDTVIDFVAAHNSRADAHIGYFGEGVASITDELAGLDADAQYWVTANADGVLYGVLGAAWDAALARVWLYGPIITVDAPQTLPDTASVQPTPPTALDGAATSAPAETDARWHTVADALYAALRPHLPAGYAHELFCDAANVRVAAFAARHGIPPHSDAAVLNFTRAALADVPVVTLPALAPEDEAAFSALHAASFPNTYSSADELLATRDNTHQIFAAHQHGALVGYAAVYVTPSAASGYIDYIAVVPGAQGRGVGADLLAAALHWMFGFPETQMADLTVDAHNQAALRLYKKLGFTTLRVMRAFRGVGSVL